MSISDALFILENKGVSVKMNGKGMVARQVPEPGTKLSKGLVVNLDLI
jgi:hypothetical protein